MDDTTLGELLNELQQQTGYIDTIDDRVEQIEINEQEIITKMERIEPMVGTLLLAVVLIIIYKFVRELLP